MIATTAVGGSVAAAVSELLNPQAARGSVGRVDVALDIRILQTASSMETLLIGLYESALGTGPEGPDAVAAQALAALADAPARETLVALLKETAAHHGEHLAVFQELTAALGGSVQAEPNSKYASGLASTDLGDVSRLVDYAGVLEKIVKDTYVLDLTLAENVKAKHTLASVMAVEAQHLAAFRLIGALLRDGLPHLVRIPIGDALGELPGTLAATAFPSAMADITADTSVAEPESGALQ